MPQSAPPLAVPASARARAEAASLPAALPVGHYAELKRRVRQAGLLERQPRYYIAKITGTALIGGLGLAVLLSFDNPWPRLCTALYLGALFAQIGFIAHDVGHHQVLHAGRACTVLQLIFGPALVAVSASWWMNKHNQHHSHPNRDGFDPDMMLPVVAFSAGRARAMNRWQRLVVGRQHLLLLPMLLFEGLVLRFSSVQFLIMRRGRHWLAELLLIALHLGVYGWLVFSHFGAGFGLAFVAVHQMAFGLYMGLVFAPNHKGMLVIEDDEQFDFLLEQVLTSRNVSPSPAVDFVYGGLNYQIEHHLFPSMPRNRLHDARALVAAFCAERGIPYCQVGVVRSYRDIFAHMRAVGHAARGV